VAKPRKNRRLRYRIYRGPSGAWPQIGAGELLLEYFSDEQLMGWHALSKDIQDYHYLWFFELEGQRAANHAKLIESLATTVGRSVELGGWGRAVAYKYSHVPLSCVGSLKWVGGRFNYGVDIDSARFASFPALYLAQDPETGLREMNGLLRGDRRAGLTAKELSLCSESGVAWVAVEGVVHNVFDLTRIANVRAFAGVLSGFKVSRNVRAVEGRLRATPLRLLTTPSELHASFMAENWREFPAQFSTPANSQLFGHLLAHAGFEGVLFSSTITKKLNLAVFPRQLQNSTSTIRVIDPPSAAKCRELGAATYSDAERVTWD
jgi:hypothetical protein